MRAFAVQERTARYDRHKKNQECADEQKRLGGIVLLFAGSTRPNSTSALFSRPRARTAPAETTALSRLHRCTASMALLSCTLQFLTRRWAHRYRGLHAWRLDSGMNRLRRTEHMQWI